MNTILAQLILADTPPEIILDAYEEFDIDKSKLFSFEDALVFLYEKKCKVIAGMNYRNFIEMVKFHKGNQHMMDMLRRHCSPIKVRLLNHLRFGKPLYERYEIARYDVKGVKRPNQHQIRLLRQELRIICKILQMKSQLKELQSLWN